MRHYQGLAKFQSHPYIYPARLSYVLVDQDINFPSLADLQRCLNQSWNLIQIADASLAQNSFCSNLGYLIYYLLGSFLAAIGDVVDNHVRSALSEKGSNTGPETPRAVLFIS